MHPHPVRRFTCQVLRSLPRGVGARLTVCTRLGRIDCTFVKNRYISCVVPSSHARTRTRDREAAQLLHRRHEGGWKRGDRVHSCRLACGNIKWTVCKPHDGIASPTDASWTVKRNPASRNVTLNTYVDQRLTSNLPRQENGNADLGRLQPRIEQQREPEQGMPPPKEHVWRATAVPIA
jgi:hypothetical protein